MALDVDQLFAAGVGMSALGWCSSCSLAKLTESSRGSWSVTYLFLKINAGASPANNRSSVPTSHELSSWLRRRHLEERRALGLRLGARLSAASGHSQAVDMRPNSTGILAAPGSGVACSFGSYFGGQLANGHDSGSSAVPCPQLFNEDVQELGGCVQVASGPGCSFAVASDAVNGVSVHPSYPLIATASGSRHFDESKSETEEEWRPAGQGKGGHAEDANCLKIWKVEAERAL